MSGKVLPDAEKQNAANAAAAHVKDGMVVGLGSGTTAAYVIVTLGERRKRDNLNILGVPSSYQAFQLAVQSGIPITTLEEHPIVNVNIDGADQIDPKLNLIKGMGAALTREKVVASASIQNVIVADEKKYVEALGEKGQPVPVEVLPFAASLVQRKVQALNGKPIFREANGKLGPVVSDNGNFVMDVNFGSIKDPVALAEQLKMIPGVVETGLFIQLANVVYLGSADGVKRLQRK